MLLSIHVPKAAGNSFRAALMNAYGQRLMRDYGDWAGFDRDDANARRKRRMAEMRGRRDELAKKYDAIHGHFIADKYAGLFPDAHFAAFFRDPYQQTIAHYRYLCRNTDRASDVNKETHPEVKLFRDARPSIVEYIEWPMYRNHQRQFLGSLPISELAFVGISEEYEKSLAFFQARFRRDLGPPQFENVNSERSDTFYPVEAEVRRAVNKYRAEDVELYARAREMFARQSTLVVA